MKVFFLLVCVLVACTGELDKEFLIQFLQKIRKVSEECVAETQATKDDIKTLLDHKIPDSHEGKCMIFCFHKHFHIQNDDGSLNKVDAISSLEPIKQHSQDIYDKVVKIFNTCFDTAENNNDSCIYASNLAECAIRESKSMGLDDLMVIE
ncbi:general odorant-binding protein 19d-like [Tribolium madens]|uniref:general odorant-binding protein 19d-like n=1 Tax=Tribolium madens TaxID=41895 RepID=UPI001CF751AF|nr:general odorant-binding protein 19d-like [Tribolium madens]